MSGLLGGAIAGAISGAESSWEKDRVRLKQEANRAYEEATHQRRREERFNDNERAYDNKEQRTLDAMNDPTSSRSLLQSQSNEAQAQKNQHELRLQAMKNKEGKGKWEKMSIGGGEDAKIPLNPDGSINYDDPVMQMPRISEEDAKRQALAVIEERNGWGWDSDAKLYAEGGGDKDAAIRVLMNEAIKSSTYASRLGGQSQGGGFDYAELANDAEQAKEDARAKARTEGDATRAAEAKQHAEVRARSKAISRQSLNGGGLLQSGTQGAVPLNQRRELPPLRQNQR